MSLLLPALCAQLRGRGVSILVGHGGRFVAVPSDQITPAVLEALRRYKPQLVAAMRREGLTQAREVYACRRCGADWVFTVTDLCATCTPLANKSVTMEPGSPAEVAYLRTLIQQQGTPVQLSPTVPASVNVTCGDSGDSGDSKTAFTHIHARA